jgi:hypothetical protein
MHPRKHATHIIGEGDTESLVLASLCRLLSGGPPKYTTDDDEILDFLSLPARGLEPLYDPRHSATRVSRGTLFFFLKRSSHRC